MNSIRKRIIIFLLMSLSILNVTSGYYIYQYTQEEIAEVFNAEQAQLARTISSIISNASIPDFMEPLISLVPDIEDGKGSHAGGHHYEQKIAYQVWDLEGNLLLMSENAPLYPFAAAAPGFSQTTYDGNRWHIFSLYSNTSKKWIYTAQHDDTRQELMTQITKDHLLMMLMVNILVLVLVVLGVVFGTRPISLLGRELALRGGSNLSPIQVELSKELMPIKNGINHLLERIEDELAHERGFNADLSHELRTPLAAIKVHAQNIELKETLSDSAQISLQRMVSGIDIMSQTIEQLLLLNRIESQQNKLVSEEVGLHDLAKEVLTLLPMSIHQAHDIELKGENIFVQGNKTLLGTLIRNLVENASKYSDKDSPIVVEVGAQNDRAFIDVVDSGPGMTAEQKENAVKRQYRVSDTQAYGSGLGLSIVLKITELHKGELRFIDRGAESGLIARISLPFGSVLHI